MGFISHRDRLTAVHKKWRAEKFKSAYEEMESYMQEEHGAISDLQKVIEKIKEYESKLDLVRDKINAHRYVKDTPTEKDKIAFETLMQNLRVEHNQLVYLLDHMKKLLG